MMLAATRTRTRPPTLKPSGRAQRTGAAQPDRATILLANDHERARLQIRALLVEHGYRVIDVADGLAAVRAFHAFGRQIAAVLLDHRMPGLMGVHVAEAIHVIAPEVPIVSVSPLDDPLAPYRAGLIRAAVRLPCMSEELLRTVRTLTET